MEATLDVGANHFVDDGYYEIKSSLCARSMSDIGTQMLNVNTGDERSVGCLLPTTALQLDAVCDQYSDQAASGSPCKYLAKVPSNNIWDCQC